LSPLSTRDLLHEIVRLAYGGDADAEGAISEALRSASVAELLTGAEELRRLARAHLMPLVRRDHGPTLAAAVMDELNIALAELAVQTSKSTVPPSRAASRSRLVLVVAPAGRRDLGLEEQLARANFGVVLAQGPFNLGPARASPYQGVVAIVDDPAVLSELKEQAEGFGYLGAVVICVDAHPDAEALARELGAVRLLPRSASAQQIVASVQELLW
jgi:hypothetical protein